MTQQEYNRKFEEITRTIGQLQEAGLMPVLTVAQAIKLLPENPEWTRGIPVSCQKPGRPRKSGKEECYGS